MPEQSVIPRVDPGVTEKQYQSSLDLMQRSLKARADAQRSLGARMADKMTSGFGSMPFLLANCLWFAVWIIINLGLVPSIPAFDPFPFGLLTMIVSLEAIILAIVVLISQNRAARIADLREEMALQVEEISEREVTKLLELVAMLLERQEVNLSKDQELRTMLRQTDTEEIIEALEKEV